MKRTLLAAGLSLSICSVFGACAEESATDIPDQSAESLIGKGRILEELVEVVPLAADAERSPLIEGFASLMTFDEAYALVKDSSHFLSFASRLEARGVCPGLYTRMLEVFPWSDLGFTGKITLTFYNDTLGAVTFETGDPEGYKLKSATERGVQIRTVQRNRREPHTDVWIPVLPPYSPIYSDVRVDAWQNAVNKACRYQSQIEDGVSEPVN